MTPIRVGLWPTSLPSYNEQKEKKNIWKKKKEKKKKKRKIREQPKAG